MKYTIYKTTCVVNGKVYIGKHQTEDIHDDYVGSGKHLNYAIKKYGKENFKKEILHIFNNEEEMNAKEAELVTEEFCLRDDTYNICPGGKGGWNYINSNKLCLTENHRIARIQNLREASKHQSLLWKEKGPWYENRMKTMPSFDKNHTVWVGRTHSEDTKRKIGDANKLRQSGSRNSQYGSFWITDGISSRKIRSEDEIPIGWKRSRTIK